MPDYRYRLTRRWDSQRPAVLFVMLNPSTADETRDDPTIRRCSRLARDWGYGSLEVVNLFALRATDPRHLRSAPDPVGADNDRVIADAAGAAEAVVAAWGNRGAWTGRADHVLTLLQGARLLNLGLTRRGQPRHPLYAPAGVVPLPWNLVAETFM